MCPACTESAALAMAGVTSAGAVSAFLARVIAHITRPAETERPEKERNRHEHESERAPEGSLAS